MTDSITMAKKGEVEITTIDGKTYYKQKTAVWNLKGRFCIKCQKFKKWGAFNKSKAGVNGKLGTCSQCNLKKEPQKKKKVKDYEENPKVRAQFTSKYPSVSTDTVVDLWYRAYDRAAVNYLAKVLEGCKRHLPNTYRFFFDELRNIPAFEYDPNSDLLEIFGETFKGVAEITEVYENEEIPLSKNGDYDFENWCQENDYMVIKFDNSFLSRLCPHKDVIDFQFKVEKTAKEAKDLDFESISGYGIPIVEFITPDVVVHGFTEETLRRYVEYNTLTGLNDEQRRLMDSYEFVAVRIDGDNQ